MRSATDGAASAAGAATDARGRLLVSIHDVGPRFEHEVGLLRALLAQFVPLDRVAMLVVPDHWGQAPIVAGSAFAATLRDWAAGGADVFAHGWFHRDAARHRGALARFKAARMTAGEGEFLGLDQPEAARRMRAGYSLLAEVVGRAATGFIAPAWLYGPGARAALAAGGFGLAEDHWRVWDAASGRTLCRGPVITWASRSGPRIASSLLAARALPPALAAAPVVRVAVHPGDVRVPRLMDSIARTLDRLARRRTPARYRDLLAA